MFCRKCGAELGEGRFCPDCGTECWVPEAESEGYDAGRQKKKRYKKWILAGIVLFLALAAAAGIIVTGKVKEKQNFEKYLAKGDRYLEKLDYESAEDFYLKAIEIAPKEAEPYIKLAETYLAQDKLESAREILEQGQDAGAYEEDDSKVVRIMKEIKVREEEKQEEEQKEEVIKAASVDFTSSIDGMKEYALINGLDQNGNIMWSYETAKYDAAQLERVSDLGMNGDAYYFVEDGRVVALSLADGSVLWENKEFMGSGTDCTFGPDGTLYITGYLGPDLFVVDAKGNTVKRIDSFDSDYFWPFEVEYSKNQVIITFEGNPSGDGRNTICYVDLDDYSFIFR